MSLKVEKYQYQIGFSGIFGLSEILNQETNWLVCQGFSFRKLEAFEWDLDWRNQASKYRKEFESRVESKLIAFLSPLDYQDSDASVLVKDYAFKSFSLMVKFLVDTPLKDIKPLVIKIQEFEYWVVSILIALWGRFRCSGQSERFLNSIVL